MRLLHVADLHLDRAFGGMAFAGCDGARRRSLLRQGLEWAVDTAIEGRADALTIGGDLFEIEHITSDTAAFIARQLGRLDCPVVLAAGNHDPATAASPYRTLEWPANVTLALDPVPVRVETPDAVIWALGYASREIDGAALGSFHVPPNDGRAQLLVVHAVDLTRMGTDRDWGSLGLLQPEVRAMGIDHALLGHIHSGQAGELMSWPGSPVPLDPSETTGNHGALWVDATAERVVVEAVAAGLGRFDAVSVDAAEVADSSELGSRIRERLEAIPERERALVTIRLYGRRAKSLAIEPAVLAAAASESVMGAMVVDATEPEVDLAQLALEPNARGRAVAHLLEDGGDIGRRAAQLVVDAFEGDIRVPA
jgi:DNA repair exonuclease SbcCD nuclease subunit